MFTLKDMPSATTFLTAYASIAGSIMFVQSIFNQFVPQEFQAYIMSKLHYIFGLYASYLTMVIEEYSSNGISRNQVYEAAEIYLPTKINSSAERLKISKSPRDKTISLTLERNETVIDNFDGIQLTWKYVCREQPNQHGGIQMRFYELSFLKKHMEKVQESYLPYVLKKSQELKEENKVVKLLTCGGGGVTHYGRDHETDLNNRSCWSSINLEHPSTFDTLAMDSELKTELMEDLDRFVSRREYYKRVGKAWKRGYLLYGPPGTGKSSLIAAMANYLKFDIYDLELANLRSNSSLRSLLASTSNRSILVIEDIDCSTVNLKDREFEVLPRTNGNDPKLTLSGLLNFIDGLWSSCGDERIIIFTTNHKEKLDPALLRPGRMDMHIHMSYCTPNGFRLLASNYLSIHDHHLFEEIDKLIQYSQVTPAEVAEELMKSDDADRSLDGLVKFLKRKKIEGINEVKVDDGVKEETMEEGKIQGRRVN